MCASYRRFVCVCACLCVDCCACISYVYTLLHYTTANGVLTKKKLDSKDLGKWGLIYYNSLFACPLLIFFMCVFKREELLLVWDVCVYIYIYMCVFCCMFLVFLLCLLSREVCIHSHAYTNSLLFSLSHNHIHSFTHIHTLHTLYTHFTGIQLCRLAKRPFLSRLCLSSSLGLILNLSIIYCTQMNSPLTTGMVV
jgi:hypothetical protein